jgi:hypothetical protein
MSVSPTGSPAWTRAAAFTDYGGHLSKANYQGQAAVNLRTDFDAAALQRLADHLTSCARVGPFAVINYTNNDTPAAAPTINWITMMTGIDPDGYADGSIPPSGFVTMTRISPGVVRATLATSYIDPYGVSGAFQLRTARATILANNSYEATTDVATATNEVDVYCWDTSGPAAVSNQTVTLVVG